MVDCGVIVIISIDSLQTCAHQTSLDGNNRTKLTHTKLKHMRQAVTNNLAYCGTELITLVKCFITKAFTTVVIKLFFDLDTDV